MGKKLKGIGAKLKRKAVINLQNIDWDTVNVWAEN